ncbi:post-transcriptional regulator [Bacillus sp. FJAT-47783]|uniref:post-transcriptional regulator n=1 Tax=Bacillus sp. FJAT-47783 TaxID=2922712 RepID=UPI001FACC5B4|nr:post-transcriptional regulator [Bacillus sp. FJAT-47783]
MLKHPADSYRDHVKPFIISKMEEFHLLGYDKITEEELWTFLKTKKWKEKEEVMVHRIVADIFSVKVTDFMNYATIESFKEATWFDSEDAQNLLKDLV